ATKGRRGRGLPLVGRSYTCRGGEGKLSELVDRLRKRSSTSERMPGFDPLPEPSGLAPLATGSASTGAASPAGEGGAAGGAATACPTGKVREPNVSATSVSLTAFIVPTY